MSRSSGLSNHPAVSFTVRKPSPLSREVSDSDLSSSFKAPASGSKSAPSPLGRSGNNGKKTSHNFNDDSSDEDAGTEDEIITGFDSLGVQRKKELPPAQGPLVIPALANRDWRAAARKRQTAGSFVPEAGRAAVGVGADGSVGGLGIRDTINSGPQVSGIVTSKKIVKDDEVVEETVDVEMVVQEPTTATLEPLTEDQKALQAILAGDEPDIPQIDMIPTLDSTRASPKTETEAYREDVLTRPDSSTMEDYERVPIDQFGAALLRGMGWKEGMAASKTRKGPVEPYMPVARPALLGIGAKERAPEDIPGGSSKKGKSQRPEKRYIPVVKRARDGASGSDDPGSGAVSASRSTASSRQASQSPPPRRDREQSSRYRDDDRGSGRDDRYGRESDSERYRSRDEGGGSRRDRDRDRARDQDGSSYQDRDRDRNRDRDGRRDYERDGDRSGHSSSSRRDDDRRDRDRDRDRGRDRDGYDGRSRDYDRDRDGGDRYRSRH